MTLRELLDQLNQMASKYGDALPIYLKDPEWPPFAAQSIEFEPSQEYGVPYAQTVSEFSPYYIGPDKAVVLGEVPTYTLPDKIVIK